MKWLAFSVFIVLVGACNSTPDALAPERATCAQLAELKELRAGLSVNDCALQLKAAAPKPALREAEASVGRW